MTCEKMARFVLRISVMLGLGGAILKGTDAWNVTSFIEGIEGIVEDVLGTGESIVNDFLNELHLALRKFITSGLNLDIKFSLFTRRSNSNGTLLEPDESVLKNSTLDPNLETKFLIHGYMGPNPTFTVMKNELLQEGNYNVIVVDWSKYSHPPYIYASIHAFIVGCYTAELIHFLMENAGVKPERVHLIGHSLGAHISGFAGKETQNLRRISGLDAAGPIFQFLPNSLRLYYTDAAFVDGIHTSGTLLVLNGFGTLFPYADQDFFPNGGYTQPGCKQNSTTPFPVDLAEDVIDTVKEGICNHSRATLLYLASINACRFLAVNCSSGDDFEDGDCPPEKSLVTQMGFFAKPIPSLPPKTKFYLNTSANYPYCNDGN